MTSQIFQNELKKEIKMEKKKLAFKDRKIESSNLEALTYDSEDENLIIEFNNGTRYRYKKVPVSVIDHFLDAESKGKFFHNNVKSKYEYEKIASREEQEREDAIKKTNEFLDKMNYKGEREILEARRHNQDINIAMVQPYCLLIVKPDGVVVDDYEMFGENGYEN